MTKTTAIDDVIRTRIREIRDALGLTQADLSKAMIAAGHDSLIKNRISEIERGKRKVTLAESLAFAYVLRTSLGDLTTRPAGGTVWPTPQAGFNAEYWRYWLGYGYPVGLGSEAKATRARIAASAAMTIARISADRLKIWEAHMGRVAIPQSDSEREVVRFRDTADPPALTVTAGVANVEVSAPSQVPD